MLAGQDRMPTKRWLDEAARAHPGPDATVRVLYGLVARLVEQLAEATGEDRERMLGTVLR